VKRIVRWGPSVSVPAVGYSRYTEAAGDDSGPSHILVTGILLMPVSLALVTWAATVASEILRLIRVSNRDNERSA